MQISLTYNEAIANLEKVMIKGRFTKADVFITRSEGSLFVVKDYAQKGFWERNCIGRIVIGREARAYEALDGIEGLPPRFKRLSPYTFAVEYLAGKDLGSFERGELGRRSYASSSGSLTNCMTTDGCISICTAGRIFCSLTGRYSWWTWPRHSIRAAFR